MTFFVGAHPVGRDQPPLVIAEAGVNHNGDPSLAHRLVDAAADVGAHAVKFQTFHAAFLATAAAEPAAYQRGDQAAMTQRGMLEALQLGDDVWANLAQHAVERGIVFLSTPFDRASVHLVADIGAPAMKIGSGDLTNALLLRAVGALRRPVILSTGMGTLEEVAAAVDELRSAGTSEVALLHCASIYPAPMRDLNLRAIGTLVDRFGLPVGFSDHSVGITAAIAAVACGAVIIEKHLTVDRSLPGPDHAASLEPDELRAMVLAVRDAWEALGDGAKAPRGGEREIMRVARRSLVAARDLPAGQRLTLDDLDARRPGTGVSPMRIDDVVGRTLVRALFEEEQVRADDVDPPMTSAP